MASSLSFENGVKAVAEGVIEMPQGFPFTMELTIAGEEQGMNYRMRAGRNLEDVASAVRESWLYGVGEEAQPIEIDPYDAYTAELTYFVNCIDAGRPITAITPAEARHVLRVILSIQQSLETGRPVEL